MPISRLFSVVFTLAIASVAAAADSPNFVLVLSDDQGWTGTSAAMHPDLDQSKSDFYQTPNLERLADRGMRFTQGYSPAGLCCPTRRSIQFGQTSLRQGDDDAFIARYQPGAITHSIPMLLKEVNPRYAAAHYGKWDLRGELAPEHLGYDEGDGNTSNKTGSEGDNGAPDTIAKDAKWTKHVVLKDPKRIFSMTERANNFMTRMSAAKRPFFVQVSHYAVHVDVQARAKTIAKYRQRTRGRRHNDPAFAAMTEDLDGGSFRAVLENEGHGTVKRPTDAMYFHRFSDSYGHLAIRVGDYKLVRFWGVPDQAYTIDKIQLFNLAQDVGESNNVAGQMPDRARQLEQKLLGYLKEVEFEVHKQAQ